MSLITKRPICVTGGSGFLASWTVKKLLDKGFKVHTTTRKMEKALFLNRLPNANSTNLKIFSGCDFGTPNSFDKAIEGCYGVIHCASPFFNEGGTRENLIEPAVSGTEMVLNTCKKYDVKRVTLTSSSASVIVDYGTKAAANTTGNHVYTDKDFSPADILEEHNNYYSLSKLYGELKAWELSKEEGCPYRLCVLNPSIIWGPMTKGQTHLNTSSALLVQYMDGTRTKIQNGVRCVVDIRDVAEAHISPIEKDVGWGKRYLLFGGAPHFKETASCVKKALEVNGSDIAKKLMSNVPTEINDTLEATIMGPPADKPLLYDTRPAQEELGIKFRSVDEMITSSINELLANGFTGSHQYDAKKL